MREKKTDKRERSGESREIEIEREREREKERDFLLINLRTPSKNMRSVFWGNKK